MRKRLSGFRKEIVSLLDVRGIPLSVKDIHSACGESDLSTVYRALEYLESAGMVKALAIPCGCGQSRYYYTGKDHIHYLHCEECHSFIPIPCSGMKKREEDIRSNYNFDVTEHVLLFFGKCGSCKARNKFL